MAIVATLLGAAPAMAATSTVDVGSDGDLRYLAALDQANLVTISGGGDSIIVHDTGTDLIVPGNGCAAVEGDPQIVTCGAAVDPAYPVDKVVANLRDLGDQITLSVALPSLLSGRDGSDFLNGGSGLDMLKGGDGNDTLNGNDGNDFLTGEAGDDLLAGGAGADTADYATSTGATVDLNLTVAQNTGAGMDSLSEIENVNGSTTGRDILTGDAGPNTFIGSGGDDKFEIAEGGSDVAACGAGSDEVILDRSDTVRGISAGADNPCELIDDFGIPDTTITSGPSGPTNQTQPLSWSFRSNEPWADFQCTLVDTTEEVSLDTTAWDFCRAGHEIELQAEGTSKVFAVRAVDDQTNEDPSPEVRPFTIDTIAPETQIDSGPSGGAVTSDPTPTFFFRSNEENVTFGCFLDGGLGFECSSPFTTDPLVDGIHTLIVQAVDAAGNADALLAESTVAFRVDTTPTPGPGDGPVPVQQAKIIIGSLVLISGNTVKMSRKGRVSISLTCAGAAKCTGRLSITTAEPVSKRSRKLVTLGAKKFTIAANKKRRINVRFSKSKMRLAKRLKRFKAKAVIREIDLRGNPRISTRIFILRAR